MDSSRDEAAAGATAGAAEETAAGAASDDCWRPSIMSSGNDSCNFRSQLKTGDATTIETILKLQSLTDSKVFILMDDHHLFKLS